MSDYPQSQIRSHESTVSKFQPIHFKNSSKIRENNFGGYKYRRFLSTEPGTRKCFFSPRKIFLCQRNAPHNPKIEAPILSLDSTHKLWGAEHRWPLSAIFWEGEGVLPGPVERKPAIFSPASNLLDELLVLLGLTTRLHL